MTMKEHTVTVELTVEAKDWNEACETAWEFLGRAYNDDDERDDWVTYEDGDPMVFGYNIVGWTRTKARA